MSSLDGIKILIADDEPSIVQFLELGLSHEGAAVITASDGAEALSLTEEHKPHIVILDIMMPKLDGFHACQQMKAMNQQIAIIMLTAKDNIEDRVHGLQIGADDYIIKPFSFSELLARIHARLRNQFPNLLGVVRYGLFSIDDRRKELIYDQQLLELSPTEYELLKFLIMNHGVALSKAHIVEQIWSYQFGGDYNIVEVYVRALREKLGDKDHKLIRTLRGVGYRMDLA